MPPKRKAKDAAIVPKSTTTSSKKQKTSITLAIHDTNHTKYTPQQERAIQEFQGITQADRTAAARILKSTSWNVSNAVNLFFSSGSNIASSASQTKISAVFDGYPKDESESSDELGFDGVTALLNDFEIGLEDIGALVLFEVVQSPALGKITRKGFVDGFRAHNADSKAKMKNVVLARRAQLPTDSAVFKAVYNHTFTLSIEPPKKAIDLEQAAELWKLLFSENGYTWDTESVPWLEWWLDFLTTKWNKAVNKDLWRQTFAFAEASHKDPSLSFWNEESSWPSVIDDFVEWVKSEKKIGDAMEVE